MESCSSADTANEVICITYTAYNFEQCKHTILEYTKDVVLQNLAKGIKVSREDVNAAFEANVKRIYAEGVGMRGELLQQVSS